MSSFSERLFELLFKYRPLVFEKGHLTLSSSWPAYLLGLALVAVAAAAILRYRGVRGKSGPRDRWLLGALRASVLAVVLFCLFRPALIVSTVVPQRSFVGVLLDDSLSMQIADRGGRPRSRFITERFGREGGNLLARLAERFKIRLFRFSTAAGRVNDTSELTFTGAQTHLGHALAGAVDELATVPLAGLVLVTDGADNSPTALSESLATLRARRIPVYTVGLGEERFAKDIELARVEAPRRVLKGSALVVDVSLSHRGYRGSTVRLDVEDSGQIVSSREIELPEEGEAGTVPVHFTVAEAGPRRIRFRVAPQPGEMVTQNNEQEVLLHVEDRREKILYFEGEPRFEVGFLRRAIADDENLQVACLLRTAPDKYYRLDVEDAEELAGGFPATRQELFRYRGLILGSVEAGHFTHDQLQMMADFVSQRGGGLLMLGGRRAFAAGGYRGTPVEEILPVVLEDPSTGESGEGEGFFAMVDVELTPSGRTHPITQLAEDVEESGRRWEDLPPLSVVSPIRAVKPGATTLLTGRAEGVPYPIVVLALQRYGRGKTMAFTVQDSWQWQMHADISLEDMTHEMLWRKLLRWLVSDVPDPVMVTTPRSRLAPGEPVLITAEISDETYLKVNNARVRAEVKAPSGERFDLGMEWTVEKDGEYRASFTPQEKGLYEIRVDAEREAMSLGSATTYVEAVDLAEEYFHAEMQRPLLERIAEETGGRFYTTDEVARLPEDMSYTEGGTTVVERKDLWDMPAVFLLLIALLGTEWGYRKLRGLA